MDELQLLAEWRRATLRLHEVRAHLDAAGVPCEAILRAGYVGAARISTAGRTYTPCPSGDLAIVMGAWWGPPPSIYSGNDSPHLADLIAWKPKDPTCWWSRTGTRGLVLGEDKWTEALGTGGPVTVRRSPLGWLKANCQGVVVLDDAEGRWEAARARGVEELAIPAEGRTCPETPFVR